MSITDLVFDYGWRKPFIINFQGKDISIDLVFDAYENEKLTADQDLSYQKFVANQADYEQTINSLLNDYILKNGITETTVNPEALMIKRSGEIGLLCDCECDIEHGIVVILHPQELVTIQDDFL